MNRLRTWIFFGLLALGIVAVRMLPDLQIGLSTIFSGYGVIAFILVMVLLLVIFRTLQGSNKGRGSEHDGTPWWY
jgi:hypothetical protein